MKKIYFALFCCLSLIMAACTADEEWEALSNDKVEISADIVPMKDSRISVDAEGKGHFTQGDMLRLYVQPDFASMSSYNLTLDNGVWQPQITWDELGAGDATFAGYYPRLQYKSGVYYFQIPYNQSKKADFQSADLLSARVRVAHGQRVDLNFEHAMSRVAVQLNGGQFTEEDFSHAVVEIWGFTKADVDPMTGKLVKLDYGSLSQKIRMNYAGNGRFQAILFPHEIFEEWQDPSLNPWITLTIKGTTRNIVAPTTLADGTPFTRLEPGKEVTVNLNLSKEDPAEWANQTKWVYGLHNPPTSEWGCAYADAQQKIIGLTWKREYGWFDCNKVDPSSGTAGDNNMCWAASCSNMLHWWLEQNKENVARYGKYTGPSKYPNSFESEIFQLYKDNFENEGYHPENGLNWFFTGRDGSVHRDGAAFFKDVFGVKTVVRAVAFSMVEPDGKRLFSNSLKQAFRDKEAICCSFILPNGGAHAINIWGAEFDAEGYVSALYIVDNNDRGWEDQEEHYEHGEWIIKTGLFRKPIVYKNGVPYMESSAAGFFTMRMNSLVFLGLHEREWEAYFQKQS